MTGGNWHSAGQRFSKRVLERVPLGVPTASALVLKWKVYGEYHRQKDRRNEEINVITVHVPAKQTKSFGKVEFKIATLLDLDSDDNYVYGGRLK